MKGIKITEWILRLGVFGTFIGHGILALHVKENWIPLITAFGFSRTEATSLMPLIGMADIAVACVVLLWPLRSVLLWATLWALTAGLSRIIAGEPVWEFIERFAEWGTPLTLFAMQGFSIKLKDLFSVRTVEVRNDNS